MARLLKQQEENHRAKFLIPMEKEDYGEIIAELAERCPIIIHSNPSSRKNLDVRPYKVLILTCVVNCTAGTPTPRLCSVVQWSVHWAPSRTTRVLVLARKGVVLLRRSGKKIRAPLSGLVKSIY